MELYSGFCFSHHGELALLHSENSLRLTSITLAYRSNNIPAVSSSSSQLTFSSTCGFETIRCENADSLLEHINLSEWMNMQFGFTVFKVFFLFWFGKVRTLKVFNALNVPPPLHRGHFGLYSI